MAGKVKIVMVDDEVDLCAMVKMNLEDKGEFEVVTCSDPRQAESLIIQNKPDLILLDVVMPGLKGSDLVKGIRKAPETKNTPIIIVSGKGEMVFDRKKSEFKWLPNNPLAKQRGELPAVKGAEALAEAYGVNDYVAKPFATELLIEVIKDVLSKTRKAPPGEDGPSTTGV